MKVLCIAVPLISFSFVMLSCGNSTGKRGTSMTSSRACKCYEQYTTIRTHYQ